MRGFFTILIMSFFSISLIGQTKIDCNSFNYELLEELVLKEVNTLRKTKKAPELKINTILEVAAQNQSDYQSDKNKMTHNQTSKKSKYVWLRVQNEGGVFTEISENVAYSDAFGILKLTVKGKKKTLDASTYEGLAEVLYLGWKNSSQHYKAMINKKFDLTGLKFKMNSKNKRVYATQVFAKK
jgi:uncharacterized protein YkwD